VAASSWVHDSSLNESCQLADQGPGLARSKGYSDFYSGALIGERTARGDSSWGAALWSAGWAARGGGSPELAVYSAPDLGF
jgi:hypothetical protein